LTTASSRGLSLPKHPVTVSAPERRRRSRRARKAAVIGIRSLRHMPARIEVETILRLDYYSSS
jgi:hypothetical protein